MDLEELASGLSYWVREQVTAAKCQGVVLGLSGGMDSSVVAVLCQRAFPKDMLAIIMPCHSPKQDIEHAKALAQRFAIPTKTIVLDDSYDTLLKALPDEKAPPDIKRLAQANLKARLRMLTLYYFANQLNYLVVGSGNRDELAIGYFTKYGDGGVDIMPMGNLVKGEVRELARHLGIPKEIIEKPPSAGLWEGQTDEAEIGFSYDDLDRYLLTGDATENIKRDIEVRKAASNHKRTMPPIAPV